MVFVMRSTTSTGQQESFVWCPEEEEDDLGREIVRLTKLGIATELTYHGTDEVLTNKDGSINEDCIAISVGDIPDVFGWLEP